MPYNVKDRPQIKEWESSRTLLKNIINNNHITRAVFVYDNQMNFLFKYDGVTDAQRALNINHSIIKKYAELDGIYQDYIFSFKRLNK